MATDYGQFILSLLQGYFPELDLDSDSDMYSQIVQPILDRLGANPLDTNLLTFIPQRIKEEYPALKVDEAGAVLVDAFINPTILIFDAFKRELQAMRAGKSLRDLSTLADDEVDSLLANVFVERRPGARATGTARIYFGAPLAVLVDPSTTFTAKNGQVYVADGPQAIDVSDMALNVEDGLYYCDVDVISILEDEDANIEPGELLSVGGLPAVIRVTNLAKFSGAVTIEATQALVTRAETLITERSMVTERGIKTTILQENTDIEDVSVVGMHDTGMTRDILRGELVATSSLGHGPAYAGGHDANFDKSVGVGVWPLLDGGIPSRFPLNDLIENLGQGTRDWHTAAIAVGDEITCEGFPYDIAEVIATWENATVRLPIEVLVSSSDLNNGGTSRAAGVGPYWEGSLISGSYLPHAPLFITDKFCTGVGAISPAMSATINPATDFLAVRDTTHTIAPLNYSRTKFWPVAGITANLIQVYSNNLRFRLQELRIKVGCGPDVTNPLWWQNDGEGIDTTSYPYGGASLQEFAVGTINYIQVALTPDSATVPGPLGGFLGVGGNVSPGDIITLFTVTKTLNSREAVFWFEARIQGVNSSGKLYLSVTSEWLTRWFPDVEFATPGDPYDVLGPFALWANDYRWYWSIREGTGEGSTTPYSKYGWAPSFLPAMDLPQGYTWNSAPAGYSTQYRQPGESYPEARTNTHAATFSSYKPWGASSSAPDVWTEVPTTQWAIVRFPSALLPAFSATNWTQPIATPTAYDQYPFGSVGVDEPFAVEIINTDNGAVDTYVAGVLTDATKAWTVSAFVNYWVYFPTATLGVNWTRATANGATTINTNPTLTGVGLNDPYYITPYRYVFYPVRFYSSNYMFGLPEDGDPDGAGNFACDDTDKDWVLRKDVTSIEDGLSIVLSQIPGITAPVEVPPNEFHVGGMADVYGKPTDVAESTSMSLYPALNYVASDVVLPAPYLGAPASAGATGIYGTDDGKFTSADLTTYDFTLGDLLVILGPTTSPYYLHSYAVVGKPSAQSIRVYPPFTGTSVTSGHTFVILNSVTMSLSPAKVYRIRNGADLVTSPGVDIVSSPTANFVTLGVRPGDTLAITEGRDQGTHTIVLVQNSYLQLSEPLVGHESQLSFDIYLNQGSMSLPVTKIRRMYMGTSRSRSGQYLPYGDPAGALVQASAMVGNSLAVPNSSNAGTAGAVDISQPFRFTDASVDFTDAGVAKGDVLYIKTGAHVGTYSVVAIESETLGPSITQDMHLRVKGLSITESEGDLEYEVGSTAQGNARCYFFDAVRALFDANTLFQNTDETLAFIPDPRTDATIFSEETSDTDLYAYGDSILSKVFLRSPTVDFAIKGIRANSAANMGYSGDSDLVYLLHQPIISTGTIVPGVLVLAGLVLELEINGALISYSFSENLDVEDVPSVVNKAFPAVELTWDSVATKYYLFSTSDVVIGNGDANDILLFKDGTSNTIHGVLAGPHRIAYSGITVWDTAVPPGVETYPPLSATKVGQIELLKYDSAIDEIPDGGNSFNAYTRIHAQIRRPGAQLFEAADMTATGSYYYIDVDVASKYPGPERLVPTETSMYVTGVASNGFTYAGDEDTSYSPLEVVTVGLPTYYFDEVPIPILGGNLDIEYSHVPAIQTMHSFLTSKYYRTVCANILGLVTLPCEVYASVTYTGSKTTAEAEEEVRDYFESFPPGGVYSNRAFISAMKSRGLLVTSTPTVLIIAPDKQRRYWLSEVSESYTLADNAAFLAIDLVVQKGY